MDFAQQVAPMQVVERVRVASGVALEERRDEQGQAHVELRAPDGTLLVELDPSSGTCRIRAPRIEVQAQQDLRLGSHQAVRIEGEQGIFMRSGDTEAVLDQERFVVRGREAVIEAERIGWKAKALSVASELVETEARRLVQRAGHVETHARRLVERTRESFREVEDLAQTKAGRLRLVAEDTLRAMGRRTLLKAREDMKLRGERIYLD
ncbi:MAG: DUF3540 domain-containing protein [Myxococcales bacterium]|nr:DUF3540 domain-containing protein [Myxococcales bacterium]